MAEAAPPPSPVLAAATVGTVLVVLAWLAYSRIGREDALQSAARARLLAILAGRGPQPVQALADLLGVHRTTIVHHARVLERSGHAKLGRVGRTVVLALPDQGVVGLPLTMAARAEAAILAALASVGHLPRAEVEARAADVSGRTRRRVMDDLARRGVLRIEWDGRVESVRLLRAPR